MSKDLIDVINELNVEIKESDLRWSQLMSNLESVVQMAHDMKQMKDMSESEYQVFNESIWRLENLAREIKGDDE
jgi:ribosomal protein L20